MLALSGRCLSCLHSLLFENVQANAMGFLDTSAVVYYAVLLWLAASSMPACVSKDMLVIARQCSASMDSNNIYLHISPSYLSTLCLAHTHIVDAHCLTDKNCVCTHTASNSNI